MRFINANPKTSWVYFLSHELYVSHKITKSKTLAITSYYGLPVKIIETHLPGSNVIVWLVDCPAIFVRPGGPYADQDGQSWQDNALRFAILCHAAVDIALLPRVALWFLFVVDWNGA